MPIAYKAQAVAEKTASDTNALTITINVPAGIIDGIVDVTVECVGAPTQGISTATYDGSNMTQRGTVTGTNDNFQHVEHWFFKLGTSPGTGNRNIILTPSATCRMNGQAQIRDGVDQTTPYPANDVTNTSVTTGTTATVDVPSTISGEFVCDGVFISGAGTLTVGANQNQRTNNTGTSDAWGGSDEPGNGGTVTMSWTMGSATDWVTIAWRLTPAPSGVLLDAWHPPIQRQHLQKSEIIAY